MDIVLPSVDPCGRNVVLNNIDYQVGPLRCYEYHWSLNPGKRFLLHERMGTRTWNHFLGRHGLPIVRWRNTIIGSKSLHELLKKITMLGLKAQNIKRQNLDLSFWYSSRGCGRTTSHISNLSSLALLRALSWPMREMLSSATRVVRLRVHYTEGAFLIIF